MSAEVHDRRFRGHAQSKPWNVRPRRNGAGQTLRLTPASASFGALSAPAPRKDGFRPTRPLCLRICRGRAYN
jgi:hypothetical protein